MKFSMHAVAVRRSPKLRVFIRPMQLYDILRSTSHTLFALLQCRNFMGQGINAADFHMWVQRVDALKPTYCYVHSYSMLLQQQLLNLYCSVLCDDVGAAPEFPWKNLIQGIV